jgi:hypothetical protein
MADHHHITKLEKKITALEARVHRLETVGGAQHFNFMEDFVRQQALKKRFRQAQDEQAADAITGGGE